LTIENHTLDQAEKVLSLLDDDGDVTTVNAVLETLHATPSLMGSLMAVQFVKDALNGNPCPDRHYTARIMRFIETSEAQRGHDDGRVP
jgi:hypothetical protein